MFDLLDVLRFVVREEGSDLHLKVPSRPLARIHGQLQTIEEWEPLKPADTDRILREMLTDHDKLAEFDRGHVLLRHMVIHPDEGVIARVAGARCDPGTGVCAMALTGGSFARRPEIRRVEPDSAAEVRIDATLREVEFYGEVQSSGAQVRSESSVLERSRGRRGARGVSSLYPAPSTPSSNERSRENLRPPPALRPAAPRSPRSWSFESGPNKAKPPKA